MLAAVMLSEIGLRQKKAKYSVSYKRNPTATAGGVVGQESFSSEIRQETFHPSPNMHHKKPPEVTTRLPSRP